MKDLISKVWNADCVEGMQQFEDDFFDWAIVDIEYCLGASKPTKKPNKVKQKNGNEIFFKNEIYERFSALRWWGNRSRDVQPTTKLNLKTKI